MVGPSISETERDTARRRMKIGFVVVVAVSGGLVAFQSGATPTQALGATVGGAVVGGGLLWFVLGILEDIQPGVR
ncbi:MAG: hypothetical protein J07HB67_02333 [halophilic archaeon J07HB67]|jgi:hypothetical protein|nr:MAG: hypothetical protein J07HB67_02333 [halophilic archaeon J07HB67]